MINKNTKAIFSEMAFTDDENMELYNIRYDINIYQGMLQIEGGKVILSFEAIIFEIIM